MFMGKPLFEGAQSFDDLFSLTFKEGKITAGDTPYLVPDQMDVPTLMYKCEQENRQSDVTFGNTSEFLESYADSVSKSGSASLSIPFLSTKASVSASFAHSSAFDSSQKARKEGKDQ